MQVGSPYPLLLIDFIATGDMKYTESLFHKALEKNHVRGEWFEVEFVVLIRLIGYIEAITRIIAAPPKEGIVKENPTTHPTTTKLQKVEDIITKFKNGITRRRLMQKTHLKVHQIEPIVAELKESGVIISYTDDTKPGPPTIAYKLREYA